MVAPIDEGVWVVVVPNDENDDRYGLRLQPSARSVKCEERCDEAQGTRQSRASHTVNTLYDNHVIAFQASHHS